MSTKNKNNKSDEDQNDSDDDEDEENENNKGKSEGEEKKNNEENIFEMSDLRIGGKYLLGKKLGSGSFGDIYLGTNLQGDEYVAIKLVK